MYFHVRYSPRCTIIAEGDVEHLSEDGEWLLTYGAIDEAENAPVHVWNTRTGKRTAAYLAGIRDPYVPRDGKLLLGIDADNVLSIVDWRAGESRRIAVGEPADHFYSKDAWCVITLVSGERLLIDLRSARIVRRFPRGSELQWRDDGRLFVHDGDELQLWNLERMHTQTRMPLPNEKIWEPLTGRWICTWTIDAAYQERYAVWDLTTKTKRHTLPVIDQPYFSVDGERIAFLRKDPERQTSELVVMETASGRDAFRKKIWLGIPAFSLDRQLLCLTEVPGSIVFELKNGEVVHRDSRSSWFLSRKNLLVPQAGPGAVVDARTGVVMLQLSHLDWSSPSEDEQYIFIFSTTPLVDPPWPGLEELLPSLFGKRQLLQVYETDTLREVYRVRSPPNQWGISKDGGVIITYGGFGDDESSPAAWHVNVWETSPFRAYVSAGLSGALAVLVVLAAAWWRRRRKRAAA